MIYVQHLLGVGHLQRMTQLANALSIAGAQVLLVSGGMPVPHIHREAAVKFMQLPPLRAADATFSGLVDQDGNAATDAVKTARTARLIQVLNSFRPEVLVVELFPLGRRQMRFELLPLLEAARPMAGIIACSMRDIVNHRPRREAEAIGWLNSFFDLLLVHGDQTITPIADSVPGIAAFSGRVVHTGYLAPPPPPHIDQRTREILVSAGGGAVGDRLFMSAAEASQEMQGHCIWRIRHGGGTSPDQLDQLRRIASPDTIIEPVSNDFRARLGHAALSVSQFGYNTAIDLVQTQTPAIVIPFSGGGETEQSRRASAFAGPGLTVIVEKDLTGQTLATAVREVFVQQTPFRRPVDMYGLMCTVDLLMGE